MMQIIELCKDLPDPWRRRVVHIVGGLTGIGLGPGEEHLLVVSHAGRSVISLVDGERVSRGRSEIPASEFREKPFAVVGIGPLAGVWVDCAGVWGGALSRRTSDGWSLPSYEVLLSPEGQEHRLPPADADIRAAGFNTRGSVLFYASAASLTMYYRGT